MFKHILKPFGLQSHPAQMHNTPVVRLAQTCRAGHMYHTTSSTVCCIAWCVAIMLIHAFHSLMPAKQNSGSTTQYLECSTASINQSDGCISRSNVKLSHCKAQFPGAKHLQLQSHLPHICAVAEKGSSPHVAADSGQMLAWKCWQCCKACLAAV